MNKYVSLTLAKNVPRSRNGYCHCCYCFCI